MKTLNRICQVLCIALGLAAIVFFFMNFVTITYQGKSESLVGTVLAFGGKTKGIIYKNKVDMAISVKVLFCLMLTVLGFVMSIFSFKKKGLRYAVPFVALGDAIFMLVLALSNPWKFIDMSALLNFKQLNDSKEVFYVDNLVYTPNVLILAIVLFAFAAFATAYLFIDDYIEVSQSKGKKTIIQRIGLFFRDYKSEVKKIVWPGFRDVVKNTVIVLVACLLIGLFIWLLDWGLGSLIKVILNVK